MSNDMLVWVGLALEVVHLVLTLRHFRTGTRRRTRRIERFRSFKGWGVEWTTYDREDDNQS